MVYTSDVSSKGVYTFDVSDGSAKVYTNGVSGGSAKSQLNE